MARRDPRLGRTDLLLVVAGVLGLVSFSMLVEQTSIATVVAPAYGLRELPRIASEHARNAGVPTGIVERAYFHGWRDGAMYTFVAAREGAAAARSAAANRRFPMLAGVVEWDSGTRVEVDRDGALISISRKSTSGEAVVIQAKNFDVPVAARIDWTFRALQELPLAIVVVGFLAIGWKWRRETNLLARWRITSAVLQLVIGTAICWLAFHFMASPARTWVASVAIGLTAAGIWIFVSAALEKGFLAVWPQKLTTLIAFLEGRVIAEGGRSIVRGILAGFALLGADLVAFRIVSRAAPVWLDPINYFVIVPYFLLSNPVPVAHAFVIAVYQALLIVLAAGLIVPLIALRVRRPAATLIAGAVALALLIQNPVVMMGAVQPWSAKMLFLFAHSLVLTWLLMRFDLLTLAFAVLTFGFGWTIAQLILLTGGTSAEQWVWTVGWGACLLFAASARLPERSETVDVDRGRPCRVETEDAS